MQKQRIQQALDSLCLKGSKVYCICISKYAHNGAESKQNCKSWREIFFSDFTTDLTLHQLNSLTVGVSKEAKVCKLGPILKCKSVFWLPGTEQKEIRFRLHFDLTAHKLFLIYKTKRESATCVQPIYKMCETPDLSASINEK